MAGSHKIVVELVAKGQKAAAEFKKVRAESDALERSTSKTGKSGGLLSSLGISAEGARTAMKGAAVAAAGLAAVKLERFAADSVRTFASATSEVRAFQRASGASAETSSKFVYALRALGVDSQSAATGMFMLSKRIGSGATDLSKWGVAIARTKDGAVDIGATVLRIGDAYKAMKDPAQRAALAQDAFGKGGLKLVPILGKSRIAIKQLFDEAGRNKAIFSQDDLDTGREFNRAMDQIKQTVKGFKLEFGREITPAVTDLTESLNGLLAAASDLGVMKAFGLAVSAWVAPLKSAADIVNSLTGSTNEQTKASREQTAVQDFLAKKTAEYAAEVRNGNEHSDKAKRLAKEIGIANEYLGKSQDAVNDALKTTAQKAVDADRALQTLKGTLFGLGDSQRGAQAALLDYADAQDRVRTAIDTLNEARLKGRQDGESEASFNARIAGLQRDVERAVLDTASAQDKVAKSAVDALTSQKAYDAAVGDKSARQNLIRQLQEAKAKYGDTTGAIQAQIDKLILLNNTPITPKTIKVENGQANSAIEATKALLGSIDSKTITLTVALAGNAVSGAFGNIERAVGFDLNGNGVIGRYSGGPVPGPQNRAVPVMAHGGEYVLSADVVQRIKAGRSSRGADGSSGGGGSVINVTVNSLVADANTGRAVARALAAYQRTGGV